MEKWFEASGTSLLAIVISAIATYIIIILFTKIVGKRSFSKMSSLDFAITIAIGSIIASTIILKNVSLLQGFTGLFIVYAIQYFASKLRRFSFFQKMMDNDALLLMDGSTILTENLKKANVTECDLKAKLREANVLNVQQVRAVVFEATGDISVLHASKPSDELESWLIEEVKR